MCKRGIDWRDPSLSDWHMYLLYFAAHHCNLFCFSIKNYSSILNQEHYLFAIDISVTNNLLFAIENISQLPPEAQVCLVVNAPAHSFVSFSVAVSILDSCISYISCLRVFKNFALSLKFFKEILNAVPLQCKPIASQLLFAFGNLSHRTSILSGTLFPADKKESPSTVTLLYVV